MRERNLGWRLAAPAGLALCLAAGPALAAEADASARLADLAARIEAQERLLARAQADLAAQKAELEALLAAGGGAVAPREAAAVEQIAVAPAPAAPATAPTEPAIRISGALRTDFRASGARSVGGAASGFYLAPPDATGREAIFDATAQYSHIALAADGPELLGFSTGAQVALSFFNGGALNASYGLNPAAAFVWMSRDGWTLSFGRRQEVFADREPEMTDTTSALNYSGNAANSPRTQFRIEHRGRIGRDGRLTAVVALTDPVSTYVSESFSDRTEDNGAPYLEAGLKLAVGPEGERLAWPAFEAEASGVYGTFRKYYNLAPPFEVETKTLSGVAVGGAVRLGPAVGLQGEVYSGQALGEYSGALGATVNAATRDEISGQGGWLEAAFQASPSVRLNLGYGRDTASRADLNPGSLARNETVFANLFWTPAPRWRLGAETTWRQTGYLRPDGGLLNNDGLSLHLSAEMRF
ncbi:MAG: hypothetical protein RL588_515 [Pseudomonadota bacterium]|jgi:hypothetical protein